MLSMRIPVCVLLLILFLTVLASAAAGEDQVWRNVSVTTVDGVVHENVSVTWILDGYNLALTTPEGERINLGPLQVTSIHDAEGRDITNEVAAASPADDVGFALLGDERTVPFQFKVMLGVGGSGALTTSDGTGSPVWAGFAGMRIKGGERMHLHALYRRQHLAEAFGASGASVTGASHEIHLLLGYRLNHPRENDNYAYLEAGLALMDYDHKISGASGKKIESDGMQSGFTLQGGAVMPLSDSFAVDLGALIMVRPALIEDDGSSALLFGLNVALTLR